MHQWLCQVALSMFLCFFCPKDKTKLEWTGNHFGMMDSYRRGNDSHIWTCPKCGKSKTGAKGKTKGEFKEEDTPKYKIETAITSGKEFSISKLADDTGFDIENIKKIIPMYMKKKKIKGTIQGDKFIPQ